MDGEEYSIIKQISAHLHQYSVVIKDDSVVGNYHDDHQGGGGHGEGILLLHCSFSLITHDSHICTLFLNLSEK